MMEIIGVVASARNRGPSDPPGPEAFVPPSAAPVRSLGLVIRTRGTPLAMVQTIKREIWTVDPGVAIAETDELMTFIRRFSYAAPRLGLFVFGAFAAIGLALVVLGVYSLVAYTVARQTREIGIRMAIGADRGDVASTDSRDGPALSSHPRRRDRPGGELRDHTGAGKSAHRRSAPAIR